MKVSVMPGISIAISDKVKVLIFGKAQLENFPTLQTRKFPNGPLYKMAILWKVGPSQCTEADLNEVIEYAKPFRAITALDINGEPIFEVVKEICSFPSQSQALASQLGLVLAIGYHLSSVSKQKHPHTSL